MPVELCVIIVSYNTRDLTIAAIDTLLRHAGDVHMQVVVWDNASQDGSAKAIGDQYPDITLIAHDENLGFAEANNRAIAMVESDWILLLNPDTETQPEAVGALLEFAKANPQAGIVGGRTVFPDGSLNPASCWAQMTVWSLLCTTFGLSRLFPKSSFFNTEGMGGWQRDSAREVDIVVGCFLLLRRTLWDKLGGFNRKYFMYGEEADLCFRARAFGYRPMITPKAQIMHLAGASEAVRHDKVVRLMCAKASLINDHWGHRQRRLGIGLLWLWIANRRIGSSLMALLGNDKFNAAEWREIWKRRKDWLRGYS